MKDCDEPTLDEGPEHGSRWGMVFDGAVNQYGNGIGAVIITPQGTQFPFTARLTFKCTNNMVEHEACIMGLEEAINLRIKHLDVYGDSALVVNHYGNGIGEMIITPQGTHFPFIARLTFKCTNNMGEYKACIMGLKEAIDLRIKYLDVYGDSALVVNQIKCEWETNQPSLIPYRDYARRISTFFTKVEFHHIPQDENQMADALATLASMIMVKYWNEVPNLTEIRIDRPTHVFAVEEVKDEKPWYF
jgi:ribonuclease HI